MKNSTMTLPVFDLPKLVAVLLLAFCTTIGWSQQTADLTLTPDPALTAEEVVDFQLSALKQGNQESISATFRFASPANRKVTGPLSRFSQLFDAEQYRPMLENQGTEIKLVSNDGVTAELLAGVVDKSGDLHWYRFQLSKQSESPYENCWMTDAVMAVPHSGRSA